MRFAIISNPASGAIVAGKKARLLQIPAQLLHAQVHGLDTTSEQELAACARELARKHEVLVVAGGDGTFSDVMNALAGTDTILAYLPLGSGNALKRALNLSGDLTRAAQQIASGCPRTVDLIRCDGKRLAFMASVGLDPTVLRLIGSSPSEAGRRFRDYAGATLHAYLKEYRRSCATLMVDGATIKSSGLLNVAVMKQPYYGFGLKMVPNARFDDEQLHLLVLNSTLLGVLGGVITALTLGNCVGEFFTGQHVELEFENLQEFQSDGDWRWQARRFRFEIVPKALKICY